MSLSAAMLAVTAWTETEALPDEANMTERQREALEAAFRAGDFDWPRESTAESLDVSSATLHGHLRKAENRLLRSFFEEDDGHVGRPTRSLGRPQQEQ